MLTNIYLEFKLKWKAIQIFLVNILVHLNNHGRVRLTRNYISYIKKLWRCKYSHSESNTSEITKTILNEKPSIQVLYKQNKSLDIDDLTVLRRCYPLNPILNNLNLNSLRNKIVSRRLVFNEPLIYNLYNYCKINNLNANHCY